MKTNYPRYLRRRRFFVKPISKEMNMASKAAIIGSTDATERDTAVVEREGLLRQ